jgi:succinoglycan biosynthesis protein ExoM
VGAPRFRVIIADNHAEPTVDTWLAIDLPDTPFELRVLHAPQSNISRARNALLDAATADWIAFIDDDEIASPQWLATLWDERGLGDVVFGPVHAQYPADAPDWLVRGDFMSKRPARRAHGYDTGPTANVLVRRAVVGALRFDPALGNSGGEDTMFFARLHDAGARLGFCEQAIVSEAADPARSTFSALQQRSRASGRAHARVLRMRGRTALRIVVVAACKSLLLALAAMARAGSPVGWRREWLRAAMHIGVVAEALGLSVAPIYGAMVKRP